MDYKMKGKNYMTKLNKVKINNAIKSSEDFIKKCKEKGHTDQFTDYGLTIYGCEVRNLKEYKEMLLFTNFEELTERLQELYQSI